MKEIELVYGLLDRLKKLRPQFAHEETTYHVGHVAPLPVLGLILTILLILTGITVWSAGINFGVFNIWIAMFIATIKATLVVLYFMHLKYDRPLIAIFFISSVTFLLLFCSFALMDSQHYQPDVKKEQAEKVPLPDPPPGFAH